MRDKPIPRWFSGIFAAVMILLCVIVASQLIRQATLRQELASLTNTLTITEQRLYKQQMELEQATASLPEVEAELAVMAPQAEAVYQQEQELRAQRKALREEAKALQAELDALVSATDDDSDMIGQAQAATDALATVLQDLNEALKLLQQ